MNPSRDHQQPARRRRRPSPHGVIPVLPLSALGFHCAPATVDAKADTRATTELNRRLLSLNKIELYRSAGYTRARAAQLAGVSTVTAWRWLKTLRINGVAALRPRYDHRSRHAATPAALAAVEQIALQLRGQKRAAWLRFARQPECPTELAGHIRPGKRSVPKRFLAAIPLKRVKADLLIGPTQFAVFIKDQMPSCRITPPSRRRATRLSPNAASTPATRRAIPARRMTLHGGFTAKPGADRVSPTNTPPDATQRTRAVVAYPVDNLPVQ